MLNLENMRPGEKVLQVVKRHWIVYILLFIYFIIGVIASIGIYFGLSGNILNNITHSGHLITNLFLIIFWQCFALFLFIEWLNHELDMYVVTNNRVIGIDQVSFLNRNVSECNLGQVQEVNSKTAGIFANILNYGTLSIQTAGNVTTLRMGFCPDSMQMARKILNIVDDYRDKQNLKSNNESEI